MMRLWNHQPIRYKYNHNIFVLTHVSQYLNLHIFHLRLRQFWMKVVEIMSFIYMSKHLIGCAISATIATAFSLAVGHNSRTLVGIPSFYTLIFLIHLMQIIVFIPSKILNTEMLYDLTGSLTYILAILMCLLTSDTLPTKHIVAAFLVIIWAARLGGFLFFRILRVGHDSRFIKIKQETLRFFMAWFLQGLWISLTASPVYILLTKSAGSTEHDSMGAAEVFGLLLWVLGLVIESVADFQKLAFNSDKKNEGRFIHSGLWKYSRHPNYCGEIILWTGVAVFVFRSLHYCEYLSLISPIFVYLLLTKLSGVPLLEAKAAKKWGGECEYEKYKATTPALFPWPKQGVAKFQQKNND